MMSPMSPSLHPALATAAAHTFHDPALRRLRRGQYLRGDAPSERVQRDIGEGPTDVDRQSNRAC